MSNRTLNIMRMLLLVIAGLLIGLQVFRYFRRGSIDFSNFGIVFACFFFYIITKKPASNQP